MLRTGACYLKAAFLTLPVAALMIAMATLSPAWAAAPDGQEDICSSPAVIFCDNFENRATGFNDMARPIYKNPGWGQPGLGNEITVINASSGNVYNGTRGVQFYYPASTTETGLGFMAIEGWNNETDLYFRYYHKFSANWRFSDIATKGFETLINHSPGQSMYNWWSSGDTEVKHFAQNVGIVYSANVNGGEFRPQLDRWYCWEIRVKYNSGSSNGILEAWVDGVQRWNYQNVALDSPGTTMLGFLVSGYWNRPSGGYPTMYRWFDNFVVSRQRIGCLSTDTTPPAAVTGLRAN